MNKKIEKEVSVFDLMSRETKLALDTYLVCVAGRRGLENKITRSINRPGLALNGIFISFGEYRIQLFGKGEINFLYQLEKTNKLTEILTMFFSHAVPCCIVSHGESNLPPKAFIDRCEEEGCPLLLTDLSTADVSNNLFKVINELFAPLQSVHGVFLEVHDLGVLLKGESGIGKSEIALDLIEKNKFRFIADDHVLIRRIDKNTIMGYSEGQKQYQHNLEIRGIGLVNIAQIFGVGTVLNSKKLDLIVELKPWDDEDERNIDRLEKEKTIEILGVQVPHILLGVKAGRNMALLIETAAMKHRLSTMGFHGKENPYLW